MMLILRLTAMACVIGCVAGPLPQASAQQAAALPSEKLKEIKAATVYVKVSTSEYEGSGSGFVVRVEKDAAWLVTNHHVIALPESLTTLSLVPKIEIVFHSGTKDEWKAKATVTVDDSVHDLALLKIQSAKPLPKPLALTGAAKIQETTPVYVCGFPFGEALSVDAKNPEISIGPATISSLRNNERGELVSVQLNGALNPGNSGGPVVTTDGLIVGVAVTTVKGAGLGFAVPQSKVADMIQGRVDLAKAEFFAAKAETERVIRFRCVDPFSELKDLKLRLAPTAVPRYETVKPPAILTDLPGYATYPLVPVKNGQYVEATFVLPKTEDYLWVQTEWTDPAKAKKTSGIFRVRIGEPGSTDSLLLNPKSDRPKAAVAPAKDAVKDLKDAAGKDLKPVSAKPIVPAKPPENWIDLVDLNEKAGDYVGKKVCVHALTIAVTAGTSDGTAMTCYYDDDNTQPSNLDFTIDQAIFDAVQKFRLRNGLYPGQKLAVRLTGTIGESRSGKWKVFAIDRVDFLTPDGGISWTAERKTPHKGPDSGKPAEPKKPLPGAGSEAAKKPSAKDAEIAAKNDATLAALANNPLAAEGAMSVVVRLEGVERIPLSPAEPQRLVHRLIVRQDYRGKPIRNIAIYLDDALAKKVNAQIKADNGILAEDIELFFECRRYDDERRTVIATLTRLCTLNKDESRSVKLELSSEATADFTKPGEAAPEPAAKPVAAVSFTPAKPPKAAKPVSEEEDEEPAAAPVPAPKESNTALIAVGGVLFALGVAAIGFLIFKSMRSKGTDRRDSKYDVLDDDDEEEDDRPRRRRPRRD